jgi:nascent polypeptide-associated complex subunit alpha
MSDKPEESKPVEEKPEEKKAEEPKPEEKKAEEPKPEESKPEEKKPEESKPEESKPEEAKPSGKAEKKVRKALSKLGMTKVDGVNRVTMRQKDSYILYVKNPEVFSSQQNPNSFIIFGELTFDDDEKKLKQDTIEQLKKEGEQLKTVKETKEEPKVEVVQEGEELSEEGLEKEAIETVMNEGKCSRQAAIKALRAHNGDPVEALLEIGQ